MNLDDLERLLHTNAATVTEEYTRLFHGRGNTYGGYRFLTIDSVDKVLFAVLFDADEQEEAIVSMLRDFFYAEDKWKALIVQQRYLPASPSTVIEGELPQKTF
ncbi:MAG: class I SAM-dependent methyltransferase, partial [Sulfuricurvum sp.]